MIDYEAFTEKERDTFVRNVLSERQIKAAMWAASRGGKVFRTPEEYLAFCFAVAVRKMKGLHEAIKVKRLAEPGA